MIPEELDKCIKLVKEEGRIPYFVNATSGSTVLGAYDDLDALADGNDLEMPSPNEEGGSLVFSGPES